LVGYSFGTGVILGSTSLQDQAQVFALVSPSMARLEGSPLQSNHRPKFVISGDQDQLIKAPGLEHVLASFEQPFSCEFVPGADHFWVGQEGMMAQKVNQFFMDHLAKQPA